MKSKILSCLVVILFASVLTPALSQINVGIKSIDIQNVGYKDGFTQNSVRDIVQDNTGYIWVGTPNGLFKYDGYNFEQYNKILGNENSIDNNEIIRLTKDNLGNIWILTRSSLNKYNSVSNKITRFPLKELGIQVYRTILVDKKHPNRIWVGSYNNLALLIFDNTMSKIEKIVYPIISNEQFDDFKRLNLRDIAQDNQGNIWVTFRQFLVKITCEDETPFITHIGNNGFIASIENGFDNNVMVGLSTGLYNVVSKTDGTLEYGTQATKIQLSTSIYEKKIDDIIATHDDRRLIVSWLNGIEFIDSLGNIHQLTSGSLFPIKEDNYGSAIIDRSGILWLGTFRRGLFKANINKKAFYSITNNQSGQSELKDGFINQMDIDEWGNLLAGSHTQGLIRVNLKNLKVQVTNSHKNITDGKPQTCWAVSYTKSRELWYTLLNKGIVIEKYNELGKIISKRTITSKDFPEFPFDRVRLFYEDPKGNLWIGCHASEGLYLVERNNGKINFKKINYPSLNTSISLMFLDSKDRFWLGTISDGLFMLEMTDNYEVTNTNIIRVDKATDWQSVMKSPIFSIHEDKNGSFWLASFGSGLIKLMPDENDDNLYHFSNYRKKDGLANDGIYSILDDEKGNLWISTDEGISKFNPVDKKFINYNIYDGVENNNFRKWSVCKSIDRIMFFGGTNGITYYSPNDIESSNFLPEVHITNFKVLQNEINFGNYTFHSKDKSDENKYPSLELKPDEHSFSIEFAAFQFDNPKNNRYKYMLEGIDNDWIEVRSDKRYASYSFLPPGDYIFKVKAANIDGVWNENYEAINIKLKSHWYKTIWAKFSYFLMLFLIIFFLARFQYRRQQLQNQLEIEKIARDNEEELHQAKLNFFTNISHEIKTPLTIITGLLDKMRNNYTENQMLKGDLNVILKNAKRMLHLVTQLMDFRKAEAGHMPLKFIKTDMIRFIDNLADSFSSYIKNSEQNFQFDSNYEALEMVFDPDKVEKIVSNLISNAVKHTPVGGDISIFIKKYNESDYSTDWTGKLSNEENYIVIGVKDTGLGIPKEKIEDAFKQFYQLQAKTNFTEINKGVGIGLAYSRMLVELHNGVLFAESEESKGSTFYIILPEAQSQFIEDEVFVESYLASAINKNTELFNPIEETTEVKTVDFMESIKIQDFEILVVEDNIEIRDFLKEFLASGFKVYEATDGKEGFELAIERIPDLIISDVMMPNMDGYEMCQLIKENEKTNHIPIILLTANNETEHRIAGLKAGADSYISKPFNLEHLKIRIEKLLELRNTLKKRYLSLSSDVSIDEIDVKGEDKSFLKSLDEIIEEHLSDSEFTVVDLEKELGYSRMQLYRKIKSITSLTAVEYIRNYRLKRAVDLMHSTNMRVSEIVYTVGFTNPSYFSKCFKARYGKKPSDFADEARKS